ncbi:MAG: hypothetical protein CM1200mP3_06660 [Chloroflexota bacterium]|nr:MAG: hypothetical protein CM1200mP3_06660 [Chloroflexota bacterium]
MRRKGEQRYKKQILEIQTTELDPLIDQIALLQESIEPLEQEIEIFESQREDLYDPKGGNLGKEFEEGMRENLMFPFFERRGRTRQI